MKYKQLMLTCVISMLMVFIGVGCYLDDGGNYDLGENDQLRAAYKAVECRADYSLMRTKRVCRGSGFFKTCINIPQTKETREYGYGEGMDNEACNNCYRNARHKATSAGGWKVKWERGKRCENGVFDDDDPIVIPLPSVPL